MLHVIGWDPGLLTGFSQVSIHHTTVTKFKSAELDHKAVGDLLFSGTFPRFEGDEVVFVIERFTITPKKTQAPWSLETTGLIRYFAESRGIPLEFFTPAQHKSLIKDEHLKQCGIHAKTKGGHSNDATRLVLYYLVTKRKTLTECLKVQL